MSSVCDLFVASIIDIIRVNDLTTTGQLVDFFLSYPEYRPLLFRYFIDHYDFFRDYIINRCEMEFLNE